MAIGQAIRLHGRWDDLGWAVAVILTVAAVVLWTFDLIALTRILSR